MLECEAGNRKNLQKRKNYFANVKGFLNLNSYKLGVLLCLGVLWHRLSETVSFFYPFGTSRLSRIAYI
jgi:hypothetical protein